MHADTVNWRNGMRHKTLPLSASIRTRPYATIPDMGLPRRTHSFRIHATILKALADHCRTRGITQQSLMEGLIVYGLKLDGDDRDRLIAAAAKFVARQTKRGQRPVKP